MTFKGIERQHNPTDTHMSSGARLAVSQINVLEAGELFEADRAACLHFARGNSVFRAHAKLAPVGELG